MTSGVRRLHRLNKLFTREGLLAHWRSLKLRVSEASPMTGYNPVICCGGLSSRCRPAGDEVSFRWEGIVCQWSALVLVYRNSCSLLLAVLIIIINSNNFWKVAVAVAVVKWSNIHHVVDPTFNSMMSSKKLPSFPFLELNQASLLMVLALQWSTDPELYQVTFPYHQHTLYTPCMCVKISISIFPMLITVNKI